MTEVNIHFVPHGSDEPYLYRRPTSLDGSGKKNPVVFCTLNSPSGGKMMKGVLQPGIHDFGNMFQDFISLQISRSVFFTYGQHMADQHPLGVHGYSLGMRVYYWRMVH